MHKLRPMETVKRETSVEAEEEASRAFSPRGDALQEGSSWNLQTHGHGDGL